MKRFTAKCYVVQRAMREGQSAGPALRFDLAEKKSRPQRVCVMPITVMRFWSLFITTALTLSVMIAPAAAAGRSANQATPDAPTPAGFPATTPTHVGPSYALSTGPSNSDYIIDGLHLGGTVNPDSPTYKAYTCRPSEQFASFTWCSIKHPMTGKLGPYNSWLTFLRSPENTAVFVTLAVTPAHFLPGDVEQEIERLSRYIGQEARVLYAEPRPDAPHAVIAVWGYTTLTPLDEFTMDALRRGETITAGLLVDYLGDAQRSAREGLPVFHMGDGAGYIWSADFDNTGKGSLRISAINPSALPNAPSAPHSSVAAAPPVDGSSLASTPTPVVSGVQSVQAAEDQPKQAVDVPLNPDGEQTAQAQEPVPQRVAQTPALADDWNSPGFITFGGQSVTDARNAHFTEVGPDAAQPVNEPKRVKTISVRPDGSIIPSDTEPKIDDQSALLKAPDPSWKVLDQSKALDAEIANSSKTSTPTTIADDRYPGVKITSAAVSHAAHADEVTDAANENEGIYGKRAMWLFVVGLVVIAALSVAYLVQSGVDFKIGEIRLAMRAAMNSSAPDRLKRVIQLRTSYKWALGDKLDYAILDEWTKFIMAIPFDAPPIPDGSFRAFYTVLENLGIPREKWLAISSVRDKLLGLAAYEDLASGKDEYPAGQLPNLPIIMKPGEKLVICLENVSLVKNVNHREYVGGSAGVSVRVAKGISVRTGAFRGTVVNTKVKEVVDYGELLITTQAVTYRGNDVTLRIPFATIVAVDKLEGSVRISLSNKEPMTFLVSDPSFTGYVIPFLARLQVTKKGEAIAG